MMNTARRGQLGCLGNMIVGIHSPAPVDKWAANTAQTSPNQTSTHPVRCHTYIHTYTIDALMDGWGSATYATMAHTVTALLALHSAQSSYPI
jgi:hypothetical protein